MMHEIYFTEKMLQQQQRDVEQSIRKGWFAKHTAGGDAKDAMPASRGEQHGNWHKWFGSKRLHTS